MKIPLIEPDLTQLEASYVQRAVSSGWIGGKGEFIDKFEEGFAKFIGVDHAITCSSGTMALLLAYHAIGMNPNSEVYVPNLTFIATSNMAKLFTNDIKSLPVDPETWVMDVGKLKKCIGVGVHLYGNPIDMGQVYRNEFTFVEDCAQSLGSKWRGKMTGSYGLASIFSFHSAKMLTTGEGGMVCTNSPEIAKRVRHLKNHCQTSFYHYDSIGYNGRMTNIQAALGLAQLDRLPELIGKKKMITKFYDENLSDKFIRQKITRKSEPVKWLNVYKHPEASHIRRELANLGIETRPGFNDDNYIGLPSGTTLSQDQLASVVTAANASS